MERPSINRPPISYGRYLLVAGGLVVLVFVAINPSGSEGLGLAARIPFWLLHVFGALALFVGVQRLIGPPRGTGPAASWGSVALSGVIGGVLFVPLALLLEQLFPIGDPIVSEGSGGLLGALLEEASHVVPPAAVVWLALNAPWLLQLDFRPADRESAPEPGRGEGDLETAKPIADSTRRPELAAPDFTERLPEALGTEIVALSSELHYLRVYTPRGNALILHTLRDAVSQLPDGAGTLIHRSHWVAERFVTRVRRRKGGVVCELQGGLELPVSRRKQAEVLSRFGDSATLQTSESGSSDR